MLILNYVVPVLSAFVETDGKLWLKVRKCLFYMGTSLSISQPQDYITILA